jgi:uncharacterized low-complexity protein
MFFRQVVSHGGHSEPEKSNLHFKEYIMAHSRRPLAATLGAAFLATTVAPLASAGVDPFASEQLSGGYDLANYDKHKEGKCGETSSGADKAGHEGKCGEGTKAQGEGKGGEEMKAEGEGKSGEEMKSQGEGKCGGDKATREGKCGGS